MFKSAVPCAFATKSVTLLHSAFKLRITLSVLIYQKAAISKLSNRFVFFDASEMYRTP